MALMCLKCDGYSFLPQWHSDAIRNASRAQSLKGAANLQLIEMAAEKRMRLVFGGLSAISLFRTLPPPHVDSRNRRFGTLP
jgi:hypothetical protein